MGLQDRDYTRRDRHTAYRSRCISGYGSLIWSVLAVIGFFYLVMQGHAWWVGQRAESARASLPPPESVAPMPKVPNPDPFKGDPTWHTGPRPSIEAPPMQAPAATSTVYKCVTDGVVSYSGPGNCRGSAATTLPIDPGPDAATIAKAQAESRRTIARTNAQVESLRQQALAEEARHTVYTEQARQQGMPKQTECAQLDLAIKQLDDLARSPLSGPEQDRIRAERQRVRDRQAALRC